MSLRLDLQTVSETTARGVSGGMQRGGAGLRTCCRRSQTRGLMRCHMSAAVSAVERGMAGRALPSMISKDIGQKKSRGASFGS
jgi:hypothetical protein